MPGYRFVRLLGQGGMGSVHLAEDEVLHRRVAVKLLSSQLARDDSARARFLREARSMANVEHPNVVRIYAFGEHQGMAYIVMELVEGKSLADRLADGALPIEEALDLTRQVGLALRAAWAKGIIHRDIKPSNILIDTGGQARVADFGLAKPIEAQDAVVTGTGVMVGTPHYMAPEQARGEALDFRSDLYSLGIVLYEMLTGRRPFPGRTPVEVVAQHLSAPLPPVHAGRKDTPAAVAALVARMTSKKPDERPSSYDELLASLGAALGTAPTGTSTPTPEPAPTEAMRRPRRALHPGAALLLGGAVVVAAALLGGLWWIHEAPPVAPPTPSVLDFETFARSYWETSAGLGPEIPLFSLDAPGGNLQDFLHLMADFTGFNVVVHPGISGEVRGRYRDLPWTLVLNSVLEDNQLAWFVHDNSLMVASGAEMKKYWGADLLVFSVPLDDAEATLGTVESLLTGLGACAPAAVSPDTAAIMLTDAPVRVAYAAAVLQQLQLTEAFERVDLDPVLCADPEFPPSGRSTFATFRFPDSGPTARRVSLKWEDAPLARVVDELARTGGYSVRLSDNVAGTMSFELRQVPVGVALNQVLGANALDCSCEGTMLDVYAANSAEHATLRVFPIPPGADAAALAAALRLTLLDEVEAVEPLPAGHALRFTGRLSTSRRVAFVLDRLSAFVAP